MNRRYSLCIAAGALSLAATAGAADWEFNPSVEAGYLLDDNYRLTQPGTEISVQGPMVDAQVELRARNPAGEFSFTPRVRATYFPSETEVDTTDYYGAIHWLHDGEKWRSELNGEVSDVDVVNSEQPDAQVPGNANLGQTDTGDSGLAFVKNRRQRAYVQPEFDYEMSQRHILQFGANYTDVNYDTEIAGAQQDYRNGDVSAGLVTRLSPVTSFTTRLRGARFETGLQGNSNSYGLELQWDTHTAAGTQTFVRGGAQKVNFEGGESATAWLGGAGIDMTSGRNELFADLTRSVGPSSSGLVIARDELRLRWTRDLTPRVAFLTGIRGTHDNDVIKDSSFRSRKYATADVGLQWRWEEEFSLRVAYNYTWQKFDIALTDAATSNGGMVSVLYQPSERRR